MRSVFQRPFRRRLGGAWAAASLLAVTLLCAHTPAAAQPIAIAFARTYSALETDKLYRGYLEHLAQCTGASLTNHFGQPLFGRLYVAETVLEASMPELLQSGRLHVAMVSSPMAVWLEAKGIAEPVATRGQHGSQQPETFEMLLLTRADAGVASPSQLAGAKIGLPGSRPAAGSAPPAGLAPPGLDEMLAIAALRRAGLAAGKDYKAEYPGGHERAVVGLQSGFWQAAFIAGDQFDRMVKKREARERDFRVVWRSPALPTESIVVAGALPAPAKAKVAQCTLAYRFKPEQARLFEGSDAFLAPGAGLYDLYRQLLPAGTPAR
jgi:ABC-type phosphate/phosphonate transport system substrate-binding protein